MPFQFFPSVVVFGLIDKCQLIADTEKCHESADSRVNVRECLPAGG
jgi:hypothetical protein